MRKFNIIKCTRLFDEQIRSIWCVFLLLFVIILFNFILVPSYAKFSSGYTSLNDFVGMSLDFVVDISKMEEYNQIVIDANSYMQFNVKVNNQIDDVFENVDKVYYGIWYKMVSPLEINSDIIIARLEGTEGLTSGELNSLDVLTISLILINKTDNEITIDIGVSTSFSSIGDIEYLDGKYLITDSVSIPGDNEEYELNAPNLDGGNLLPVYYDEEERLWRKADSSNSNNSWYDYSNRMWANAVIIKDDSSIDYLNANVGTNILTEDITAFYVWIPRYKYRVWNINRQAGAENTYVYSAYSTGIEIEFENGIESTGNVECTYNATISASIDNLADVCIYNGTDTITSVSLNSNYVDAWYTHPAFTFGGIEKTGFWVGKFETSGSVEYPTIIPDSISLTNQSISSQFTISKKIQAFLSSNIDAHMLTNLEWGAITYLTHSIYGLCSDEGCRDVYINNSEEYYTGRSGGDFAGGEFLFSNGRDMYNSYGYYDYRGYELNNNGSINGTIDVTKVASTTGNVSGIYDMSGGAYELVMGNMVDSLGQFYPYSAGTNWNNSSSLASKYYNSYSYYSYNTTDIASFNRARLGDGTAEILTCVDYSCSWRSNINTSQTNGAYSVFVNGYNPWFSRGGGYDEDFAGMFYFYTSSGGNGYYDTFRSSLI